MNLREQLVGRARRYVEVLGKHLIQFLRDYRQTLAGGDDTEESISEFQRLSGKGHSHGWRFNRDEINDHS